MFFLCARFIGAIPVTMIEDESHERTVSITRLPVEFGADVTDHAYVEPATVRLKGYIATGGSGIVGSFITFAGYQALTRYQQSRRPFTLITGLDFYRNMLIERISVPRNSDNANVLEFTITCRQVLLVGTSFLASVIGAPAGGQASLLSLGTLAVGAVRNRTAPTVRRGDNAVVTASTDNTTTDGRANNAAMSRIGV